jgi:hypothetical protein
MDILIGFAAIVFLLITAPFWVPIVTLLTRGVLVVIAAAIALVTIWWAIQWATQEPSIADAGLVRVEEGAWLGEKGAGLMVLVVVGLIVVGARYLLSRPLPPGDR